ncbi:hypothetical protein BDZ45DRAFT_751822 [Acephala macrosclerotiorum]|nr:hypothetical protein BDZ45DRAFT_751822 [Acephala macrosclerotiorum]
MAGAAISSSIRKKSKRIAASSGVAGLSGYNSLDLLLPGFVALLATLSSLYKFMGTKTFLQKEHYEDEANAPGFGFLSSLRVSILNLTF